MGNSAVKKAGIKKTWFVLVRDISSKKWMLNISLLHFFVVQQFAFLKCLSLKIRQIKKYFWRFFIPRKTRCASVCANSCFAVPVCKFLLLFYNFCRGSQNGRIAHFCKFCPSPPPPAPPLSLRSCRWLFAVRWHVAHQTIVPGRGVQATSGGETGKGGKGSGPKPGTDRAENIESEEVGRCGGPTVAAAS